MINLDNVKAVLESSDGIHDSTTPPYGFIGDFGVDMCNEANTVFQKTVAEYYEFSTGINAYIAEAALVGDSYKTEALFEAAGDGIFERIKEAFKKLAAIIKGLAIKFASFVTSHLGATKQWLKVNEKRLKEYHGDVEVEIRPWSMSKIDIVVNFIKSDKMVELIGNLKYNSSNTFDAAAGAIGLTATDISGADDAKKDKIREELYKKFFGKDDVKEADDLDDFIDKQLGEKDTLDVGVHKEDFVEVIKKSGQSLDKIKSKSNSIVSALEKAKTSWNKADMKAIEGTGSDDDKKEKREKFMKGARAIMAALSSISGAFSKYLTMVKKYISKGTKECMYALNKWMGKKDED